MANKLSKNPIVLDTFGSDVVVSTTPLTLNGIEFYSGTATDKFCLTDKDGDIAVKLIANESLHTAIVINLNNPPYSVLAANNTVAAGGVVNIYLA